MRALKLLSISYLNSSIESGAICSVAVKQLGRIFSIGCGFGESSESGLEMGFDERQNAEALTNLLKTEHYRTILHAGDMEHIMPDFIWHLEDLRLGQLYPNYYVARLASKFAKVTLSGLGGDEIFGGYPWRYFRGDNASTPEDFYHQYYQSWQHLVPDAEKQNLFTPAVFHAVKDLTGFDVFRGVLVNTRRPLATPDDRINLSLYFEMKTFLSSLLLVEDKISMAHTLETRMPFLDNDLVDFAVRLPVRYKVANRNTTSAIDQNEPAKRIRYQMQHGDDKPVLRKALGKIIPNETMQQIKSKLNPPKANWNEGESVHYVNRVLRDRRARILDYIEPHYIYERLDEHTSGHRNNRLLIWSLLSFEWWLRKFM